MVVMRRGDIWTCELGIPGGSEAGYDRPVIIVQHDGLNKSNLRTVIVVPLSSNVQRMEMDSQVLIPRSISKLKKDSLAATHLVAVQMRSCLKRRISTLPSRTMLDVDEALSRVLGLYDF
jgi:mRNA interferase MazF